METESDLEAMTWKSFAILYIHCINILSRKWSLSFDRDVRGGIPFSENLTNKGWPSRQQESSNNSKCILQKFCWLLWLFLEKSFDFVTFAWILVLHSYMILLKRQRQWWSWVTNFVITKYYCCRSETTKSERVVKRESRCDRATYNYLLSRIRDLRFALICDTRATVRDAEMHGPVVIHPVG